MQGKIFEIIPNKDISNSRAESFLTNIHSYRNIIDHIKDKQELQTLSWEIYLSKENIKFFLTCNEMDADIVKAELDLCYPKATVKGSEDYLKRFKIANCIELGLKEHSFLSLKTDKRGEFPLPSILEISKLLNDGEKIYIQILMLPETLDFNKECEEYIRNFEKYKKVKKRIGLNGKEIAKASIKFIISAEKEILSMLKYMICNDDSMDDWGELDELEYSDLIRKGLSPNTLKKPKCICYDTNIRIAVQCSDKRQMVLTRMSYNCFGELREDNEFKDLKRDIKKLSAAMKEREMLFKINTDNLSVNELGQLIQLPTKYYQDLYKITSISTTEVILPNELQKGGIEIGTTKYKGTSTVAYWNNKFNAMAIPKVIVGASGGGKSTYLERYIIDSHRLGHGVILFDYIKNCELSEKVIKYIDRDKLVTFDMSNLEDLPSLNFTELKNDSNGNMENIKTAYKLKQVVTDLVESIQTDSTNTQSAKMLKYLSAACMVVFINSNESIVNVQKVLQDHNVRHRYIKNAIEQGLLSNTSQEIQDLLFLDEYDKKGENIIGTRDSKIESVTDRLSMLTNNLHIRYMLNSNKYIDFTELMSDGKVVLFKMPEDEFVSKQEKDLIVSCLLSKIWLAQRVRGKMFKEPKVCQIVIDEIHQCKTAAKNLSVFIPEVRKFGGSFVLTAQYLNQFGLLKEALSGTGANYMVLAGASKDIIKSLDEEIKPITLEEALNLPKFHSLNIINNENERVSFISKLPTPQ